MNATIAPPEPPAAEVEDHDEIHAFLHDIAHWHGGGIDSLAQYGREANEQSDRLFAEQRGFQRVHALRYPACRFPGMDTERMADQEAARSGRGERG